MNLLNITTTFLNVKNTEIHINILFGILESSNYSEYLDEKGFQKTYITPYFIFDIFNKVVVVQPANKEKSFIYLSKYSPTNGNYTHSIEIKSLVKLINAHFGVDIKTQGDVLDEELKTDNWEGRLWKINDIQLRLILLNGYLQLYFDF
jgi:hypothetical protein